LCALCGIVRAHTIPPAQCSRKSVTFDPFMFLSLPLPVTAPGAGATRIVEVVLLRYLHADVQVSERARVVVSCARTYTH
jgi:hypothetical protein